MVMTVRCWIKRKHLPLHLYCIFKSSDNFVISNNKPRKKIIFASYSFQKEKNSLQERMISIGTNNPSPNLAGNTYH